MLVEQVVVANQIPHAKAELEPIILQIQEYRRRTGTLPLEGTRLPPVDGLASYEVSGDRYVVSLQLGAIDIDGHTVWYDSADGSWHSVHNDMPGGPERGDDLHCLATARLWLCRSATEDTPLEHIP